LVFVFWDMRQVVTSLDRSLNIERQIGTFV